jgi:hypothetical protein
METTMSRLAYICVLAGLLGACAGEHSTQTTLADRKLACAAIGIDPGSAAFDQCVIDLDRSLRANDYPLD